MTNREVFRRNFVNLLNAQNLMQIDIAKSMGKPKATVNKWYSGKAYPRPEEIEKIASLLHVNVERLLCDISEDESLIICAYRRIKDGSAKAKALDSVLDILNVIAKESLQNT